MNICMCVRLEPLSFQFMCCKSLSFIYVHRAVICFFPFLFVLLASHWLSTFHMKPNSINWVEKVYIQHCGKYGTRALHKYDGWRKKMPKTLIRRSSAPNAWYTCVFDLNLYYVIHIKNFRSTTSHHSLISLRPSNMFSRLLNMCVCVQFGRNSNFHPLVLANRNH